jgi:hypothetical protein
VGWELPECFLQLWRLLETFPLHEVTPGCLTQRVGPKAYSAIFHDVEELIMAIGEYIDKHNENPKPFIWTAKASDILEKVKRARLALDNR